MRVILLSAGFGTRLRPITDHIPKCLVPIHGRPLLSYWLDNLFMNDVERVLINTHYLADQVVDFVTKSKWHERIELVYEVELLGTGGTVLENVVFTKSSAFIVAHADNLTKFDLNKLLEKHKKRPAGIEMTMMTFETDSPLTCGIVETDISDRLIQFHEKSDSPPGNRANAAVYVCEPYVIKFLKTFNRKVIDISNELIPAMIDKIQCHHSVEYHRDIGSIDSLRLAEMEFKF